MSQFRNISTDARGIRHGVPSPRNVKPGDVVEVWDAVARPAFEIKDEDGNVVEVRDAADNLLSPRKAETYADGYRGQPTIWEEVAGSDKKPPKASTTPAAEAASGGDKEVPAQ
jgi:hypothetical protein